MKATLTLLCSIGAILSLFAAYLSLMALEDGSWVGKMVVGFFWSAPLCLGGAAILGSTAHTRWFLLAVPHGLAALALALAALFSW
jgi:hypothetical protein